MKNDNTKQSDKKASADTKLALAKYVMFASQMYKQLDALELEEIRNAFASDFDGETQED